MSSRTRQSGEHALSRSLSGTYNIVQDYITGYPFMREQRVVPGADMSSPCEFSDLKTITDEVGRPGNYNGCAHDRRFPFKIDMDAFGHVSHPLDSDIPWGTWVTTAMFTDGVHGYHSIDSHLGTSGWPSSFPRPIDWSSLVTDVGARLDGSMTASTNMLVVLGELTATLGMFKNPFGLLSTRWNRTIAAGKTLRQAIKQGSNVWLEYKYGWKNFFRDMDATFKAVSESENHVKYLMASKGAYSSVGKTQHDEVTYPVPNPTIGTVFNNVRISCGPLTVTRDATFSADILRGEAFRVMSQAHYYSQRVGSMQLVSALWDLVPMSFVVDWFCDLQRYLKTNLAFSSMHNLRNVGYSVKTIWATDLKLDSDLYGWSTEHSSSSLSYCTQPVRRLYERSAGFPPNTQSAGIFGGLNLSHLVDASALVAQRVL